MFDRLMACSTPEHNANEFSCTTECYEQIMCHFRSHSLTRI